MKYGKPRVCEACGKVFIRLPSLEKYCRECRIQKHPHMEKEIDKRIQLYLVGIKEVKVKKNKCRECKKEFINGMGWRKYCSLACGSKKYGTSFDGNISIKFTPKETLVPEQKYVEVKRCDYIDHEYSKESIIREYKNGLKHRQVHCVKCGYKKLIKRGVISEEVKTIKTRLVGKDFYDTREWRELRYMVIKKYGKTCMACGSKRSEIHVDHIKPRSKHPELELEFNNLQILCKDCNLGKSNKDETDWRPKNETKSYARTLGME